jgi:hemoglobin
MDRFATRIALSALAALAVTAPGCGDDGGTPETTLYERLGEESGITTVVDDFVGRVLDDPAINGYFLNTSVDAARLTRCLVKQIGNASGGPEVYPDPAAGCRDMSTAHAGLNISQRDFDDLVGHLDAALTAASVSAVDKGSVLDVLGPLAPDIVEDATDDGTVYQRVGRKPAIQQVIASFLAEVVADTRINGFFAGLTSTDRISTCLVRQICSIDGPCAYGGEVTHPADPGVTEELPCRNMVDSHVGLVDTNSNPITAADFGALVEDLVVVLDMTAASADDKMALLGALGPMCSDIVSDPGNCP